MTRGRSSSAGAPAPQQTGRTGRSRSRSAFTVAEVIVVIVLIGILAGLVVPRMSGSERRRADGEARRVQGLLTSLAQRDLAGAERLALEGVTGEDGLPTLRLLALRSDSSAVTDGPQTRELAAWAPDRLEQPVQLEAARVVRVRADGLEYEPGEWFIEISPSQPRPAIEIELVRLGSEAGWRISLGPGEAVAHRASREESGRDESERRVDLDLKSGGTTPW